MRERIPVEQVTWGRSYRAEGLDCEEIISGYMEGAAEEGAAGVLAALPDVAIARLVNQMAPATGIDKRRLCAALDGGPALDGADVAKILDYFAVPVPCGDPAEKMLRDLTTERPICDVAPKGGRDLTVENNTAARRAASSTQLNAAFRPLPQPPSGS
jgi:DNA-binding phage protein